MAGASAALEMGPKERALYLRRRLGPEPLGGPEEEASTIAGPTPGALRTWLRQVHPIPKTCTSSVVDERAGSGSAPCAAHLAASG